MYNKLKVPNQAAKEQLWLVQQGKCAICLGVIQPIKSGHLDHNHDTGQVRGLLCRYCNVGLGMFKDNTTYLLAANDYLVRHTQ